MEFDHDRCQTATEVALPAEWMAVDPQVQTPTTQAQNLAPGCVTIGVGQVDATDLTQRKTICCCLQELLEFQFTGIGDVSKPRKFAFIECKFHKTNLFKCEFNHMLTCV